jgi:hypothetical protein
VATKLPPGKEITREIDATVMSKGARNIVITVDGDGNIHLRAKGMHHIVVWSAPALYERGIREGRIRAA